MREFNTTGACDPEQHYMVDISRTIEEMQAMVAAGRYFCVTRAPRYGKTTAFAALRKYLAPQYEVVSVSFQGIGGTGLMSAGSFVRSFSEAIRRASTSGLNVPAQTLDRFASFIEEKEYPATLRELFDAVSDWCAESAKPVVLIIDGVETAPGNQAFLDFLSQLREGYLSREGRGVPVFHSVILAGTWDVRYLRPEDRPDGGCGPYVPWNIASNFNIDMSLPEAGIRAMLDEYEADHGTGMDTEGIAQEVYGYTEGYPYLVSRICQIIDNQLAGERFRTLSEAWAVAGVSEAVRLLLKEKNTFFDSLMGKVHNDPELSNVLQRILFGGERISYSPDTVPVMVGEMYGFIKDREGALGISNRIFETRLYNYFLGLAELQNSPIAKAGASEREEFIQNGRLNMEMLLRHYVTVFDDVYQSQAERIDEAEGRRRFLLFVRPVINGTGNYYIETHTRDDKRLDLVIDYLGERHVVELKVWRGPAYHSKGERQLVGYLDSYNLDTGYMLTYNFNKTKKSGVEHRVVDGKTIIEATV